MMNRLFVTLVLILVPAFASSEDVAELFSAQGTVERLTNSAWSSIPQGAALQAGDSLRTLAGSRAAILFKDGVLVRLNENSAFSIQVSTNESSQPLSVNQGEAFFLSREPKRFPEVSTPFVSAAVRGTEFAVKVTGHDATISVLDGAVLCSNSNGSVELARNEQAHSDNGAAPVKQALVDAVGSVQWAFFYPPVFGDSPNSNLLEVDRLVRAGQIEAALSWLGKLKASGNAEAESAYDSVDALRALSVSNVEEARTLASRSLSRSPSSVSALITASLSEQAALNLSEADRLNDLALKANPSSSYLTARSIELALAKGEIGRAGQLVSQALSLGESDPHLLSAVGFYYLVIYEPEKALENFDRAVQSNVASGLFQFGRGLALIRSGELERGRECLAKAVLLEPNLSIYRSYLGKAFFEEEREGLAAKEFDRAIALDPEDPTPYLYRAYNNLSQNRPVQAIEDVEQSIKLNDNRAVYRSRMLLDKDNAVRSAGLAEVFNTLGFSRAAQIEAIKSINRDYSNYSAHRLLGESYRALIFVDPLVSERKISNLLSPLSLNLFRSGSAQAGLNEYNALFERPEHRTSMGFDVETENDVIAPSISQSGRGQKFGYLLQGDAGFADGSRDNAFVRDYRANGIAQYQLSYQDRIILEGRYLNRDLEGRKFDFDESSSEDDEFDIGYHREITPDSGLLTQLSYRDSRNRRRDLGERIVDLNVTSNGTPTQFSESLFLDQLLAERFKDLRASAQYYNQGSLVSFVVGGEVYGAEPKRDEDSTIIDDEFFLFPELGRELESRYDEKLYAQDAYAYTTWHLTKWLDLILGGTYSNVDIARTEVYPLLNDSVSKSRWNPKLGLTLYPRDDLTIRAAYFESLQKAAFEDVGSLEPTLVGGINQLYSDFPGAITRNYAAGIDWKAAASTYLGVEGIHRDTISPTSLVTSSYNIDFDSFTENSATALDSTTDFHFNQDFLNAYLYQVISKQVVGALDYGLVYSENTEPTLSQDLTEHRVGATFRYFDESGWFTFSRGTWRYQDVTNGFEVPNGTSNFWLFDMGLGYRIPDRHGSVTFEALNIFDEKFVVEQIQGLSEPSISGISFRLVGNINF